MCIEILIERPVIIVIVIAVFFKFYPQV